MSKGQPKTVAPKEPKESIFTRFTVFENAPVYIFSPYLAFNNCVLSSSSLSSREEGEEDIRLLFVSSLFLVVFTAFDDDVMTSVVFGCFCCCCRVNATPPKNRPREQCSWRKNTPTLKSLLLLMSTIRLLAACRATSVRSIFLSLLEGSLKGRDKELRRRGRFVAPCELRSCYKMRNSVKLAGF